MGNDHDECSMSAEAEDTGQTQAKAEKGTHDCKSGFDVAGGAPELEIIITRLLERDLASPKHSFSRSATTTICIFLTDLVDMHAATPEKSPASLLESRKLR